jgi:hypothetical protein
LLDILFLQAGRHMMICSGCMMRSRNSGSERYDGSKYIHSCSHSCYYWRSIWDENDI